MGALKAQLILELTVSSLAGQTELTLANAQ
uniref:Uncharacterized protein n=1 Tax=Arundo donax TaxID=35708 RepID=A0A0A9AHQ2_ARUDO